MKNRMFIITLALAAVVAGSSVITVRAEDKPVGKPGHEGQHRPHFEGLLPPMVLEKIKLTADQKAKYDAIVADFQKETAPLREKMKAAREAGDKEKMKELFQQIMPLRKAAMEKLEQVLTDEQKAELKKMREEHGKRGHGAPGADQPAKKKPAQE